jgi:hypothetical protein
MCRVRLCADQALVQQYVGGSLNGLPRDAEAPGCCRHGLGFVRTDAHCLPSGLCLTDDGGLLVSMSPKRASGLEYVRHERVDLDIVVRSLSHALAVPQHVVIVDDNALSSIGSRYERRGRIRQVQARIGAGVRLSRHPAGNGRGGPGASPGLRDTPFIRLDDGTWVDLVTWSSRDAADQGAKIAATLPEARRWLEHVSQDVSMDLGEEG